MRKLELDSFQRLYQEKEILRLDREVLLSACRTVLAGFTYHDGRPTMPEWKMREILQNAIEAATKQPEE